MSASRESSSDGVAVPTEAIIEAIAAHEGVDVTDVEPPAYDPLYTVVDPAALNRLFDVPGGSTTNARVVLEYEGYEIVVDGEGRVDVTELSAAADSRESVEWSLDGA